MSAGGIRELWAVVSRHWTRGLVSVLGAFELLMAVSARPLAVLAVGVVGGGALLAAPWATGRVRRLRLLLLLVGTVPFAALTWWSIVSPLLALVALVIGLTITGPARAGRRSNGLAA